MPEGAGIRGVGFVTAVALLAALAIAAGSSQIATANAAMAAPTADPFYDVPSNVASLPDGAIIRSREVTTVTAALPMPAHSWQILYKTFDNLGHATATVATVIVPDDAGPANGPRPLVSYQIAEDSAGLDCSPSYALVGGVTSDSATNAIEETLIDQALDHGWAVVVPDYQGPQSMDLGSAGEGKAILDGIRAAKAFAPAGIAADAPVGLWGYSGGATVTSLAAQEQPTYAPKLKLAGVATGGLLADEEDAISLLNGGPQGGLVVLALALMERDYPQDDLGRYLTPTGQADVAKAQNDCNVDAAEAFPFASISELTTAATPSQYFQIPAVAAAFTASDPLTFPGVPDAPVYDYHAIGDELVPIAQDRQMMVRFCQAGVTVDHVETAGGEHVEEALVGASGAEQFLADRFAGQPPSDDCASLGVTAPTRATATKPSFSVRQHGRRLDVVVRLPAPASRFSYAWQRGVSFGSAKTRTGAVEADIRQEIALYSLPAGTRTVFRIVQLSASRARVRFDLKRGSLSFFRLRLDPRGLVFSPATRAAITAHHLRKITGRLEIHATDGVTYAETLSYRI